MKTFGKFLTEAKDKGAVFTFGRFNPPTTGHAKLVDKLKKEKSFGIYANSSIYKKNKLEGFVSDSDEWHYHNHQPISSVEYKDFVVEWIENGASVIGGCCRTTTDHIKEIKKIIEKI